MQGDYRVPLSDSQVTPGELSASKYMILYIYELKCPRGQFTNKKEEFVL